jgi:hypothetical protein
MAPHEFRRALDRRAKKLKEENSQNINLQIQHETITAKEKKLGFLKKIKALLRKRN